MATWRYRVFGPPGTGKTSWLKRQVERALAAGVPGEEIVVASFSRAAFAEFSARLGGSLPEENMGTVHSLAYRALGLPPLALTPEAVRAWNEEAPLGWHLTPRVRGKGVDAHPNPVESPEELAAAGDALYDQTVLLRNRRVPLSEWPEEARAFFFAWRSWMRREGLVDFPAMLEEALVRGLLPLEGRYRYLFVDEAQDLSPLQYALVERWAAHTVGAALIGDDDQAIYGWMGADGKAFLSFPGQDIVLSQSYRIPRRVQEVAQAIVERIGVRQAKDYRPREVEGWVRRLHASPSEPWAWLDEAVAVAESGGRALVLAPHRYLLEPVKEALLQMGVAYANPFAPHRRELNLLWEEEGNGLPGWKRAAAFLRNPWRGEDLALWVGYLPLKLFRYREARQELLSLPPETPVRREDLEGRLMPEALERLLARDPGWLKDHLLSTAPKGMRDALEVARRVPNLYEARKRAVWIGTIHSVKGGEADVVYLCGGLTRKTWHFTPWDDLHRLLYVGVTRAREELVLMDPGEALYAYPWPEVGA